MYNIPTYVPPLQFSYVTQFLTYITYIDLIKNYYTINPMADAYFQIYANKVPELSCVLNLFNVSEINFTFSADFTVSTGTAGAAAL